MEQFKRQQQEQLINNKLLRQEQIRKEIELDNVPPSGHDLMHQLYMDKVHVSYEKRAKQEKVIEAIQDQIINGESQRRIAQEQQARDRYIQNKEMLDTLTDQQKFKLKKMKEAESKRVLDIQLQEREENKRLRKYEDTADAQFISQEVKDYMEAEMKKTQAVVFKNKAQLQRLKDQIEEKKAPKRLDPIEYQMNKQLLDKIQTTKMGGAMMVSQSQVFEPMRRSLSQFAL